MSDPLYQGYQPPCAKWKIWMGKEVEGSTGVGQLTLFIREVNPKKLEDYLQKAHEFDRIWFTKECPVSIIRWTIEYCRSHYLRRAPQYGLEATLETLAQLPADLRAAIPVYLKIPVALFPSDHVCVGAPFYDESFRIGQGVKVTPRDYMSDEEILLD